MHKFVRHARHNVIAYMALFVALGGTSYAAVKLSAHSVGTRELKNGAVTGSKVRAHTLNSVNFAPGVLPRGGSTGATGATGSAGPQGPAGPAGASATGLWAVVRSSGTVVFSSHVQGTGHNGTGSYTVSFDRPVNGCAIVAQVGGYKKGGDQQAIPTGTAAAGSEGDANPTTASTVDVVTRDGTFGTADLPFHLVVSC